MEDEEKLPMITYHEGNVIPKALPKIPKADKASTILENSKGEKYEIRKNRCPKCSSDIRYTIAYSEIEPFEKIGWSLGQCVNPNCRIVTHTGNKLCQMNDCEWHEICARCGKEICGDFKEDDNGKAIHLHQKDEHLYGEPSCEEITPREYSFFG